MRLATTLLAVLATLLSGAQNKPPAKPPVADPALELEGRVVQLVKDLQSELAGVRNFNANNLVGKGYGKWLFPPQEFSAGKFEYTVPESIGKAGEAESELAAILKSIPIAEANYKSKKTSAKEFIDGLYQAVVRAMGAYWLTAKPFYDAAVIGANVRHAVDAKRDELAKAAERVWGTLNRPQQSALMLKNAQALDQFKAEQWSEVVYRVKAVRKRVDRARKKWGAELWKFYDFAEAKSATAADGHASGKNKIRDALNELFGSMPRPVIFDSGRSFGNYVDVSSALSVKEVDNSLFEAITSYSEPDIQVFSNAAGYLSLDFCLQPPVDKLRGYVEPPEPPAIQDTLVVPSLLFAPLDEDEPEPPEIIEGSEVRNVFVYGPQLPKKRSELKELKTVGRGITYEAIAFYEDYKSLDQKTKYKWDKAIELISMGRPQTQITDLKAMPAILLRAKLTPGMLPGRYEFEINGAKGGWFLDQGTCPAKIELVRKLPVDPDADANAGEKAKFEPTKFAYKEEVVFVQVTTFGRVDLDAIDVVVGKNGGWLSPNRKSTVKTKLVADEPGVYRSGPIYLLQDGDGRLDPTDKLVTREPDAIYLEAWVGDRFQSTFADRRQFRWTSPVASLTVAREPAISLWYDALERAAKSAGLYSQVTNWNTLPQKQAKEISTTMYTQVLFKAVGFLKNYNLLAIALRWIDGSTAQSPEWAKGNVTLTNRVSIGDHAAMLLLKDRFVVLMRAVKSDLDQIDTDDKKLAFLEQLEPVIFSSAMGEIVTEESGDQAVREESKLKFFIPPIDKHKNRDRIKKGFIRERLLQGFNTYKASVEHSLRKAEAIQDGDIEGLLSLIGCRSEARQEANQRGTVGDGFDAVAQDVLQLLMRPIRDQATGEVRWVPDTVARASVRSLNAALEAVRAQRDYKALDTQVVLAASSVVTMVIPGGFAKTLLSLIVNAASIYDATVHAIPEIYQKEEDYHFARGAVAVLGAERLFMADAQRTPTWGVMLTYFGTIAGVATTLPEVAAVMSTMSKHVAMPIARVLASKIKQLGVVAWNKATREEQAAMAAIGAAADLKEAAKGADALDDAEKEVQAAIKQLAEEAQPNPQVYIGVAKEELGKAGQLVRPEKVEVLGSIVPVSPGKWTGANNKVLQLGERLDNGQTVTFNVFKEEGTQWVVKICKEDPEIAEEVMQGVKHALDTVRKYGIRHLAVEGDPVVSKTRGYLRQLFLKISTAERQELSPVDKLLKEMVLGAQKSDAAKKSLSGTSHLQRARLARNTASIQKRFEELEDSMIAYLKSLQANGLAMEDFKLDNVFVKRVGQSLDTGLMDIDRISKWGELSAVQRQLGRQLVEGDYALNSIRPLQYYSGSIESLLSANEYQILMLQSKNMIIYDRASKTFRDGILSVKKLSELYPELKQPFFIDLVERAAKLPHALRLESGGADRLMSRQWRVARTAYAA